MPFEHPVSLVDVAGTRFCLSACDLQRLLRSRQGLLFLGIVLLSLVVFDPPQVVPRLSLPALALVSGLCIALFVLALGGWLVAAAGLQRRFGLPRVPLPLLNLLAVIPALGFGEALAYVLSNGRAGALVPPDFPVLWIFTEIFTFIFMHYVRPMILGRENGQDGTAKTRVRERRILIGAEPVPLEKLRVIEAREHHVHVTLDGRTLTQRARLGDIVAQTGPDDGVQPHRSWWVASGAAHTLVQDNGRPVLVLHDGRQIPVARARLPAVRDWLDAQTSA
ncbi:LytTR family DNA-binding domain-containing protein [Allosediminivita pacifica]|uniref:LytTr DNA-binding domain-containing protein n=1 Tax=Allosediminivita pacifica TaxID=1267769 RepID=A0A2T6AVA9_9RHOB|nr:LytTR family DNA-binding domain-containing protein [Allosediminivita pacifica]PTX47754.1 LytTr DNA-binding domain-containing protein [Allosediminivita pacifica]GGB13103.1 hypothetical protein GCM10011324_24070 [Allosediminivita pacifica]